MPVLPLELSQVTDEYARRAFEQISVRWPGSSSSTTPSGSTPPLVASLPASPNDGDEIYYLVNGTTGVVWHLRYRLASPSAYKWELVGGTDITAFVANYEATNQITYVTLTSPGPSITCPLAGDYDVSIGAFIAANTGTSAAVGYMSYMVGATNPSDGDACQGGATASTSPNTGFSATTTARKAGLAASTVLSARYKTTLGATNMAFGQRWMRVRPLRVG